MYYLENRYYSCNWHRFVNADDRFDDKIIGQNIYIYCNNNPIIRFDETGNAWIEVYDPRALIGMLGTYHDLRLLTRGTGLEVHHLYEVRFLRSSEFSTHFTSKDDMPSVILDKSEHRAITNEYRKIVPYGSDYSHMSCGEINNYATKVYGGGGYDNWLTYMLSCLE